MTAPVPTRPGLVVLIGPPGAGKTTVAGVLAGERDAVVSLDALRAEISGDECDQSVTPAAVDLLHARVRAGLAAGRRVVVDATNATRDVRRPLLDAAAEHGVPAVAVVLVTPLALCLARNARRPGPRPGARWGRRVPGAVIRAQHAQLAATVRSLPEEGFADVFTLASGSAVAVGPRKTHPEVPSAAG